MMFMANSSSRLSSFILLGLTNNPKLEVPLFITFTLIYLITLIGNLGMIVLIWLDSRLHTPMYLFLSNLSLADCVYSSAVTPKVMAGLLTGDKVISYGGCVAQMFFFVSFASVDCFLLAAMAFDRHAAVCKPLHYATTMTASVCTYMVIGCYVFSLAESSIYIGFIFDLSFCHSNVIHHFFCDIPPILDLSCSDIYMNEVVLFIITSFNVFFALIVILTSYAFIFIAILRMRSAEGRKKAFSTCASHLTAVTIFYGTVIFMYLQPSSSHSLDNDQMASVFYTTVVPMLNPVVYSLRNKEVHNALKKATEKMKSVQHLALVTDLCSLHN
ncbi:olfactory receptor 5B2 [Cricetulus griseus]|uniref:Olfactory receptor n=1 Tax=Cricetulus griseus TaxID=10029 RepID=G3IC46_CRIGR|nr:olfactory receptor 5B2 [Cricetulus griseus]EGW11591.1 Olfactory receptor 5B2 [Cricetulus griseus]